MKPSPNTILNHNPKPVLDGTQDSNSIMYRRIIIEAAIGVVTGLVIKEIYFRIRKSKD